MWRWTVVAVVVPAFSLAVCPAVAASTALIQAAPGAGEASAGGTWGNAIQVPGIGRLNTGAGARTLSMSCAAPGDCSAGGFYAVASGAIHAFVVSQAHDTWRKAARVSGVLTARGDSALDSVSCAAPGDCSGGGTYAKGLFVVSQVNGIWGDARMVVGRVLASDASFSAVSCGSAGNCSAGGFTGNPNFESGIQAWVISQVHGTWGRAMVVPGSAPLNKFGLAGINSLSCASAGSCSAGGFYTGGRGHRQAFVVSEKAGAWGKAINVPGAAALSQAGFAEVSSVSCASPGNCTAGGYYTDASGAKQAFAVRQVRGNWRKARPVPGLAALNTGGDAGIVSVSCAAPGDCSAGGNYADGSGTDPFVVNQVNGRWQTARQVPGMTALDGGQPADFSSLSCGSAGNCSAVGEYAGSRRHQTQVFVVNQVNGTWRRAEEVPGTPTLNKGGEAAITSVSCGAAIECSAGGSYAVGSRHHAFVVSES